MDRGRPMAGRISLQWISDRHAIMRHHPSAEGYGSDFDLMCVVQLRGTMAYIQGLVSRVPYTAEVRRLIADALRDAGADAAFFERKHGRPRAFMLTR